MASMKFYPAWSHFFHNKLLNLSEGQKHSSKIKISKNRRQSWCITENKLYPTWLSCHLSVEYWSSIDQHYVISLTFSRPCLLIQNFTMYFSPSLFSPQIGLANSYPRANSPISHNSYQLGRTGQACASSKGSITHSEESTICSLPQT